MRARGVRETPHKRVTTQQLMEWKILGSWKMKESISLLRARDAERRVNVSAAKMSKCYFQTVGERITEPPVPVETGSAWEGGCVNYTPKWARHEGRAFEVDIDAGGEEEGSWSAKVNDSCERVRQTKTERGAESLGEALKRRTLERKSTDQPKNPSTSGHQVKTESKKREG